jgi:hypothetical protein
MKETTEKIIEGLQKPTWTVSYPPSVLSDLLAAMPTNWCDPLLTGKNAVIKQPPYDCKDIERLLQALKKRLERICLDHFAANTELTGGRLAMIQKKKDKKGRLSAVRSNDLLCCPFCGKKGTIYPTLHCFTHKPVYYPRCETNQCVGQNGWISFDTKDEAIKAWNKRAA